MQTKPRFLSGILPAVVAGLFFMTAAAKAQSVPGLPENQLVLPAGTSTIPFIWQGDSIGRQWEPHAALLIPVRLAHCPRQFYMQFDLGSPYSLLYRNMLTAIQRKYPQALPPGEPGKTLKNISFEAGETHVTAGEIAVEQFDSTDIDWNDESRMDIIGTIGTDLIDGKVAVIDYPGCQLSISPVVPAALLPHLSLVDFTYVRRSILLPVKLQGDAKMIFFDTGSSMYELLTDESTCRQLAVHNTAHLRHQVKSWDKYITANSFASNETIEIAGKKIPLRYSTYMEGVSDAQVEQMAKMGIAGMTGNKLFLNYKLVLDTRNKKFGLIHAFGPSLKLDRSGEITRKKYSEKSR
ncbi:hypothetical protein [Chitinophaga sp. XS-30]|uniref:hypothetical protein n=1 Tax=Chitinophaga sp. XS-30 TaxID=2604421 RepID=UPI0011DD9428|nr:hypothetical protein [Chitinophaga sp. XS-30]QEH42003.1 hypothetical protein FW415_14425 [Chitinophaga sp. XS-30]